MMSLPDTNALHAWPTGPALYVDSPAALEHLCTELASSPWLALDTEFMREKTYLPQLCLIQVATPERVACIDPLALDSLEPLLALLRDPKQLKVLHAARQDLEVLYLLGGQVPSPVFDTQLAATVLGYGDQVSYANLVRSVSGVELDKNQTRTDWSRRPLEPEQIDYAADDVRYLAQLYPVLRDRLAGLGRLNWLDEDFVALSDPATYENPPDAAWLRVSGHQRLKDRQLAILQQLAAWRERRAREHNRPRKWVLADQVLLDLARLMPSDRSGLSRIRGLEKGSVERFGTALLQVIAEAQALPRAQWPERPPARQLAPEQDALVDTLMAVLRLQAAAAGVSTTTLAGRRELEQLALGERELPVLRGWRRGVAGETLLALLAGRLSLQVVDGQLSAAME